jgi:hypothetical protein
VPHPRGHFSDASWAALDHAANVASFCRAHLVLLHALELPRLQNQPGNLWRPVMFQAGSERRCQAALERLEPLGRAFRALGVERAGRRAARANLERSRAKGRPT